MYHRFKSKFSPILSSISGTEGLPSSFLAHNLEAPESLKDNLPVNNLNGLQSAKPVMGLNIPIKLGVPVPEYETHLNNLSLKPQQQGTDSFSVVNETNIGSQ